MLNPEALKFYRKKKGYQTQGQLAEKIGCRVDQVNRWETGRTKKPRSHLLKKLTEALGVNWEDLTRPPPSAETRELFPTTQLNVRVRQQTRTSLELVSLIFGVRRAAIVEIAPLLFLITAYKSLKDRKEKIAYADEQLEQAIENCRNAVPHLEPAFLSRYQTEEAIDIERKSIKQRELFGPWDCYDDEDIEKNNPFANYIESLLEELPDNWVDKDEFYAPYHDVPEYRLSQGLLRKVVGIAGETDRDQKILRYIADGDIDLREVRSKKDGMEESGYFEWLSQKLEIAKAERKARMPELDLSDILKDFAKDVENQTSDKSGKAATEQKEDKS